MNHFKDHSSGKYDLKKINYNGNIILEIYSKSAQRYKSLEKEINELNSKKNIILEK